jgi:transcriptional regulator with GAF, ATPase, and Fis domain
MCPHLARNVRELENVIERACLLGKSDLIRPEDLPESMTECKPADRGKMLSYHDGLNKAKKALIEEAVRRAGGDHGSRASARYPFHLTLSSDAEPVRRILGSLAARQTPMSPVQPPFPQAK